MHMNFFSKVGTSQVRLNEEIYCFSVWLLLILHSEACLAVYKDNH